MKSDSDLQHQIQVELENDPEVNVELLDVQVDKGVVTLRGNVTSDQEKWKADDIVHRVPDVAELVNNLQVIERLAGLQNADVARPWFPSGG
ncbi:MAG: BON domain-containing protein [Caldimonas sp.]